MAIKPDSFANRIRQAVHRVADLRKISNLNDECTTDAIANAAVITSRADLKRMGCSLRDMVRAGELIQVAPGIYTVQNTDQDQPEIREVMWRVLRMRKAVTVEDLMEMAKASRTYAKEWLLTMAKHGVVRPEGDAFRLLKDNVEMPVLTDNADKIRKCREKKKQAINALDQAARAIAQAKAAITDL